ncbi:hypothetical protein FGG08_003450 [Glutinoglossum americanum]|uniref:Ribosome maturation protein SDO1/SBDS N-terminal domain-containing protein n=1 Tax=Glutinoglossum americanum TaxID=1670608 RepID=A0A9P8IB26_9PEZI|nr:hypothetical protein FGG08_003450 [Glutinoglossum americanum]
MPRGNGPQTKVHYPGADDDYVIFVDSSAMVRDWKKDKSIPLAQVVSGWKIFCTHKHGAQGILDAASKGQLESEFGTTKEEEIVKIILEKGGVQETTSSERQADKNIADGPSVPH